MLNEIFILINLKFLQFHGRLGKANEFSGYLAILH